MKRMPIILAACLPLLFGGCALQRAHAGRFFHFVSYYRSGPAPGIDCRRDGRLSYCVDVPPQKIVTDPGAILYVLHHAGGSERSWGDGPGAREFYRLYRKARRPAPRVVAVSYGPYWTLMDTSGEEQEALFDVFISSALPLIEAQLGFPKKRYLWGISQGSFNGARLLIKRPDLFSGAVLSCPAVYTMPLYAEDAVIREYARRTAAEYESVIWGVNLLRPRVGGARAWAAENPLALARTARGLPPTMIQANTEDEFGFFEGGRLLAETLQNRGEHVEFRVNEGAHCRIDASEAAKFLLSLKPYKRPVAIKTRKRRLPS